MGCITFVFENSDRCIFSTGIYWVEGIEPYHLQTVYCLCTIMQSYFSLFSRICDFLIDIYLRSVVLWWLPKGEAKTKRTEFFMTKIIKRILISDKKTEYIAVQGWRQVYHLSSFLYRREILLPYDVEDSVWIFVVFILLLEKMFYIVPIKCYTNHTI